MITPNAPSLPRHTASVQYVRLVDTAANSQIIVCGRAPNMVGKWNASVCMNSAKSYSDAPEPSKHFCFKLHNEPQKVGTCALVSVDQSHNVGQAGVTDDPPYPFVHCRINVWDTERGRRLYAPIEQLTSRWQSSIQIPGHTTQCRSTCFTITTLLLLAICSCQNSVHVPELILQTPVCRIK
jgi:hypothetical protein